MAAASLAALPSSSPDPLNDSTSFTRRVTRSQRSQKITSLAPSLSPRKRTFELDVGDNQSPQRLWVTVQADQAAAARSARRRLFASPLPKLPAAPTPVIRRKERSTTTTVPLREAADTVQLEMTRSKGPSTKPKDTPVAGRKKSVATPARRTPARKAKAGDPDLAAEKAEPASSRDGRTTKRKQPEPAPLDRSPPKRRRPGRPPKPVAPEITSSDLAVSPAPDAESVSPEQLAQPATSSPPPFATESTSESDVWLADRSEVTPRAAMQSALFFQLGSSPRLSLTTSLPPYRGPTGLLPDRELDVDNGQQASEDANTLSDQPSPRDEAVQHRYTSTRPRPVAHQDLETLPVVKDYSGMSSNPLRPHHGITLGPDPDPHETSELGEDTRRIINNTLQSLRTSLATKAIDHPVTTLTPLRHSYRPGPTVHEDSVVYDDSFSEIPSAILLAATPRGPLPVSLATTAPIPPLKGGHALPAIFSPQATPKRPLTPEETSSLNAELPESPLVAELLGAEPLGAEPPVEPARRPDWEDVQSERQPSLRPQTFRRTLSSTVRAGRILQTITANPESAPVRQSFLQSPFAAGDGEPLPGFEAVNDEMSWVAHDGEADDGTADKGPAEDMGQCDDFSVASSPTPVRAPFDQSQIHPDLTAISDLEEGDYDDDDDIWMIEADRPRWEEANVEAPRQPARGGNTDTLSTEPGPQPRASDQGMTTEQENPLYLKAPRFNMADFFSSPALLPAAGAAHSAAHRAQHQHQRYQHQHQHAALLPLHTNSMFPVREEVIMSTPRREDSRSSSPVKSQSPDTKPESGPPRPFPLIAQKMNFTPRPQPRAQSAPLFQPTEQAAASPGPATPTPAQSRPPQLLPLPARHASPSKSCLRSPLKPRTPGRVVEFLSSPQSPNWARNHWLLLDALLQRRRDGPFSPSFSAAASSSTPTSALATTTPAAEQGHRQRRQNHHPYQQHPLLGQQVVAETHSEVMDLEPWHLDIVRAFRAQVGQWDERIVARRLFALIVGEKRRKTRAPAQRMISDRGY